MYAPIPFSAAINSAATIRIIAIAAVIRMLDKMTGSDAGKTIFLVMENQVKLNDCPYEKAAGSIQAGSMRLQPDGRLNLTSVKHQLDWFKSEKLVPGSASIKNLVDTSYVKTY